ncbi:Uma2 family endonuclease [Methylocapsa palsarum]|uniref:Endonuclease, Uma2 family (Restriction endonuclease fold) n=1 Tax=Methylocapsa palsarum TaxID=1612308 RepID=A0A1I4CLJ7_9HYPH|nr:Uma2 family endonuclease [Methylocapsa palsarum]SFK80956.1 Endonuclease, Uma2 family (restriction endonuclease fold) [Methylocapsa palsarum]
MKSYARLVAMNLAVRKTMTLAEFLEWEARQELRYEFDGETPVAMAGGTFAHAAIQRNLALAIGGRLRGKPCKFVGSDLKIEVAGSSRYPDGFVVCSPVANDAIIINDPVVIFEVLSPITASTDRTIKAREYQATPSVQRYVMLEQDRIAATAYVRADGDWNVHVLLNEAVLAMPEIGVEFPLAELYEGLDLTPNADQDDRATSDQTSDR